MTPGAAGVGYSGMAPVAPSKLTGRARRPAVAQADQRSRNPWHGWLQGSAENGKNCEPVRLRQSALIVIGRAVQTMLVAWRRRS